MKDIEKVKKLLIEQRKDTSQHAVLNDLNEKLRQMFFKMSFGQAYFHYKDIQVGMSRKIAKLLNNDSYQLERISENQVQLLQRIFVLITDVDVTVNDSRFPL